MTGRRLVNRGRNELSEKERCVDRKMRIRGIVRPDFRRSLELCDLLCDLLCDILFHAGANVLDRLGVCPLN